MHTRSFLDAQTGLVDVFLEELSKSAESVVNFNNTKQFDTLLQHLECTVNTPQFCSVPSENILQILFTLAARCPASNWSHDSHHAVAGDTTEYMKSINREYDSALYKASLQQRSFTVLRRYLAIVQTEKTQARDTLRARVRAVLATFFKVDISSFFRASHTHGVVPSLDTARTREPRKAKVKAQGRIEDQVQVETVLQKKDSNNMQNVKDGNDIQNMQPHSNPTSIPAAVEVISDSEDSDALLDGSAQPELALKYYSLDLPHKNVTSLSELGQNTSGLGETASLFKTMPHLSETPPPVSGTENPDGIETKEKKGTKGEIENTAASPEAKVAKKKPRLAQPPWKRIQVFDDSTVSKKLSASANYGVWSLLQWTFWCADTSSQYQKFLFNSSSTHVHQIYRANAGFLWLFFGFFHAELLGETDKAQPRSVAVSRLLLTLGPFQEWPERATEFVFSGLGVPSHKKPYPCYSRELLLTKTDPAVENSRCKSACENDDNMDSMALRVQIVFSLLQFETVSQNTRTGDFLGFVVRRLASVSQVYLASFLNRLQLDLGSSFGQTLDSTLPSKICVGLIRELTGSHFPITAFVGTAFLLQVADVLSGEKLYRSLVDDLTFACADDFVARWEKVMFLAEWLYAAALDSVGPDWKENTPLEVYRGVLSKAQRADELANSGYAEYLESRYEDSDLLPETSFTLTQAEIDRWMQKSRSTFWAMTRFKLGERE